MSDSWARASDGSVNIYPSESGMVGTLNSSGYWVIWVPPVGVKFDAEYYGKTVSVTNVGDGRYSLTLNGSVSLREYASKWLQATYYDAEGYAVAGYDAAQAPGEPQVTYTMPGNVVMTSAPTGTPPTTPAPVVNWTRSSDGADNIWAGESGMVATTNRGGFWGAWKPPVGITYQSHYHGETISIRNEGNGTYSYQAPNGQTTLRQYAARWANSTFWDARGNPVAAFESASAPGDPDAIYYAVGAVYSPTPVQTVGPAPVTPTPTAPTPSMPTSNAPTAPGNVIQFPGSVQPSHNIPNAPITPIVNVPAVVPFPDGTPVPTNPPVTEPSLSTGKLVMFGIAAWAALKGF